MASYVDNSFRQAVMMNPAERTQQVRINDLFNTILLFQTYHSRALSFPAVLATPLQHCNILNVVELLLPFSL